MESPTSSNIKSLKGSSLHQIQSVADGEVRLIVGEESCGSIKSLNKQSLMCMRLSKKELLSILIQTKIEDIDIVGVHSRREQESSADSPAVFASSVLPRSENLLTKSISNEQEDAIDFTIRYVTIPDGVLGVKLERVQAMPIRSSSSSSSSSPLSHRLESEVFEDGVIPGSFVVVSKTPLCEDLNVGDSIVAVNGLLLLQLSTTNALTLLQHSTDRRLTVVRRYMDMFHLQRTLQNIRTNSNSNSNTSIIPTSPPINEKSRSMSPAVVEEITNTQENQHSEYHGKRPFDDANSPFQMQSATTAVSVSVDSLEGWKDIRSNYIHRKIRKCHELSDIKHPFSTKTVTTSMQAAFYHGRRNILQDMANKYNPTIISLQAQSPKS